MQLQLPVQSQIIDQWMIQSRKQEALLEELRHRGHSEEVIEAYIAAWKKRRYAARRFNATIMIGIGGLMGFIGCVMLMLDISKSLFYPMLYGTSIAATVLICWGFYLLMEE